ncbi:lysoplasmalogenase-like protein TMEM86A [Amblyraja radiata]|uniref:lysoplasmalogenase-like protein TMEM86A n=1 Tax=Amblyraja radiata TaxID=386614 RepID=UPI001402D3FC|nr:lysoplasmalogenase-like protein TMEM86A [Amblyraja radiata]
MLLPFALALLVRYQYGLPEQPPDQLKMFFRFLPVLVLIILILENHRGNDFSLRLVAGMGFAGAGDVCLLYKEQHLTHSIICFWLGYCMLTVAFGLKLDNALLGAAIGGLAAVVYLLLQPTVRGVNQVMALAYMLAALLMIWRAAAWWKNSRHRSSTSAMCGTIALATSNLILPTHVFNFPVPHNQFLVTSFYYTGQLLIAVSSL